MTAAEKKRMIRALQARIISLEGGELKRQQDRDVAWLAKRDGDAAVEGWRDAVPKADYCRMAGRQNKLIDDAARSYDLPIGGATVCLADAIEAMHDLIADNASRLRSEDKSVVDLQANKLVAQIEKLRSENQILEVRLKQARGESVTLAEVGAVLDALLASMRSHAKSFAAISPAARDHWNQVCEALAKEIESTDLLTA